MPRQGSGHGGGAPAMTAQSVAGHPTALRVWERGGARPVLALHCSLAHGGAWTGLAERLSGVTVAAPDLPGHGASADWDGTGDYHDLTTRIAVALAERLGQGGPVDVIGHSFGGSVALRLALERPDLVRSLTLVEPVVFAAAGGAPEWPGFRAEQDRIDACFTAGRPEEAAALFHALWGTGTPLDRLPERARNYITDRIGLVAALDPVVMGDAPGLLAPGRLESLDIPVLLAEGTESPPVVAAIQRELARRLARPRRIRITGAGHMLPLTHSGVLAPEVQAHLDAV